MRIPGSDWLEQGPVILALRPGVARDALGAFLERLGARVEDSNSGEAPVLVFHDGVGTTPAPGSRGSVWVADEAPPGPDWRRLSLPVLESELVFCLTEISLGQ